MDLTATTDDKDETPERKGPDPVVADMRFTELRKSFEKANRSIAKHGRIKPGAAKDVSAMADVFSFFKLVPKHYDHIVDLPRAALRRIRREERLLLGTCVDQAGMPRRDFLAEYHGHETSIEWVDERIAARPRLQPQAGPRS